METTNYKIDLTPVRKLYNKIINVEEYRHPVNGWTHILPNGKLVTDEDLYKPKQRCNKITQGYEIVPDMEIVERVVQMCIDAGATVIQFCCKDEHKNRCYPDYKVSELIKS